MKWRIPVALALCVSLFGLGGRVSAELIIDEKFDANPLVDSGGPRVAVAGMTMRMWLRDMSAPFGMWQHTFDSGMASPHVFGMMAVGMMSEDPWWSTLTYFVAMPRTGWGADGLEFSFNYLSSSMNPGAAEAKFGVYGWPQGAMIPLDSATPGMEGTELTGGSLLAFVTAAQATDLGAGQMQETQWGTAGGSYYGDLGNFPFIGVTFTFGVTEGGAEPPELRIDNVALDVGVIPEPATIGLGVMGMAALAWARRRRRRGHVGAAAPRG